MSDPQKKAQAPLTEGPILKQLIALTGPSIGGFIAIMIFNLTDTFFVSRLGTEALAAMGFTFPVVMVIGSAALGISMGAGSVLSRAMGAGDHHLMQRTATDGILLSMLFVALVSIFGIFSMDALFGLLGASGEVLNLTKDYMLVWYLGAMTIMMPPVSDSCLRATGDMMRPFIVMSVCGIFNAILDPIFIFGYFGVPAMGIRGAAVATVISRALGMCTTLYFLHVHAGLVDLSKPKCQEILDSWKRILHVGAPAAATQLLAPLTRAFLTRMAASAGGAAAVAAVAAGSRIEQLGAVVMYAYGLALVPMVGQNWGALKGDRIKKVHALNLKLSLIYGSMTCVILFLLARPLASVFSKDQEVIGQCVIYLRIMALSTAGLCYSQWSSQSLNAAGKPHASARINFIGSLALMIPLAFLGSLLFGYPGLIAGFAAGQVLMSVLAYWEGKKHLRITGGSSIRE